MLKLRDFLHLPQLDTLITRLVNEGSGLLILAGIDSRQALAEASTEGHISPSGLSAIFTIMIQEILLAKPLMSAIVVSEERNLARVPRQLQRRVGHLKIEPGFTYDYQIDMAARQRPGLLVIDHLTAENAPAAFNAAGLGIRVLTQLDTVLHGSAVAREMIDLGVSRSDLAILRWVLTTQRMPVLCPQCKVPTQMAADQASRLLTRYPHLSSVLEKILHTDSSRGRRAVTRAPAGFHHVRGCDSCRGSGYKGDLSVFDLFYNNPQIGDPLAQASLLSIEEYALHLAAEGEIDLEDLMEMETGHLRRTYHMLTASETALTTANSELSRKIFELEASNRVLVQRTEVLMSLEDLGQALIRSTPLADLAARICRRAGDLCKADRVVLYLRRVLAGDNETAEILAVRGCEQVSPAQQVSPHQVFGGATEGRATRFIKDPPGVRLASARSGETSPPPATAGLSVPLIAQNVLVGVMIVQSTQKELFNPGEVVLLQTFANQAALAIQRAGLVDDLRAKIVQLETAQAELVNKERLERELELARQVQQSMLPHSFPIVPGVVIAAQNEPARQVGGDFYDMFILDDDHFGVVVADVADKGLPAALYMALTRSLLLAEARRERSPRAALVNVNRLLLELGDLSSYVSVFYGVINRSSRRMVYARAGHERPLLLRSSEVHLLGGEGMVLGVLDGDSLRLSEEDQVLERGDRLVLYTDGLTDVANPDGSFFGLARLQDLVKQHALNSTAEEICSGIFHTLSDYRGQAEQFDDMTLLVIALQ